MDKAFEKRISIGSAICMTGFAMVSDLLGLIPLLGVLLDFCGKGTLYLWFITKGVKPVRHLSKRMTLLIINIFGETVAEALFAYPGTTIMTLQTIWYSWEEDKEKAEEKQEAAKRQQARRVQQIKRVRERQTVEV